jgi:hypothetical protein
MPRLTTKPPKYCFNKPSNQAKVRYRGRDYYLGRFGSQASHEAYARFIGNLPKAGEKPPERPAKLHAPLLVSDLVLKYYKYAEKYYTRNGVPTGQHVVVQSALRPLTKEPFATLPVREFGARLAVGFGVILSPWGQHRGLCAHRPGLAI